jgi:hypothetical protein
MGSICIGFKSIRYGFSRDYAWLSCIFPGARKEAGRIPGRKGMHLTGGGTHRFIGKQNTCTY